MKKSSWMRLLLPSVVAMAIWGGAGCQSSRPVAAPAPATQVATEKNVEFTAAEILTKMGNTYAQCQSYCDKGKVTTTFFEANRQWSTDKPFTTAFVRPDRFCYEFREGETMYVVWRQGKAVKSWWTIQPVVKEGESLALALAGATGVSCGSAFNLPALLMPTEIMGRNLLIQFKDAKKRADDRIGGRDCYRLETNNGKARLWIDKTNFLVLKLWEQHTFPKFRTEAVTTYEPMINISVDAARLAFNVTPAAVVATVKVKMPSSEENAASTSLYQLVAKGRTLSAPQAAELEKQIPDALDRLKVMTELLGYYSAHYLENNEFAAKHSALVVRVIKEFPQAPVLAIPPGQFMPRRADAEEVKSLWRGQFRKYPNNPVIYWNAAHNTMLINISFAEVCLRRGQHLESDNPRWTIALAQIRALLQARSPGK